MLKEIFEIWLADLFLDAIFITVGMHIINLGYLKDGSPYFTEFSDSNTEELNRMLVGLDTTTIIPKINNQNLPDLIDLKV